ncbi:MAG: sugar ABC transporter permease [Dermabacter sp.]|nr:sugar ABC transporter permease [Dermabacter sp.]
MADSSTPLKDGRPASAPSPALSPKNIGAPRRRSVRQKGVKGFLDHHWVAIFLIPGMLWMGGLLAYPILMNIWQSLTNKNLQFADSKFVGGSNYLWVLQDATFWQAGMHSIVWTVVSVTGQLLIGLAGALALERVSQGRWLYRLLLILPWTFSSVVMAAVWRLMLDALYGIMNGYLTWANIIDQPLSWFGDARTALGSAIVVNIWFGVPFMLLSLVAGLQTISKDLYEAASVDGAGYWRQVWNITIPGLAPIISTLVVLRTIWVVNNFDIVFLTTGGGPSNASMTLPVYAYNVGWAQFEVGKMAAISVILTVVLLILALVYFKVVDDKVSHAED